MSNGSLAKLIRRLLPLFALLLLATPVVAAPAFVQLKVHRDFGATTETATFDASATTGNLIAVYVYWDSATGLTLNSVTDGTNTYTLVDNPTSGWTTHRAAQGYAKNVSGSVTAITANFSGSSADARILIVEVSGCDTAAPLDQHAIAFDNFSGAGTDVLTTGNVTTTANGEYIFGATSAAFGTAASSGTGFTSRTADIVDYEDQIQGSSGAIAVKFTNAGADGYLTSIMTFKAAGGGGGATLHNLATMGAGQ